MFGMSAGSYEYKLPTLLPPPPFPLYKEEKEEKSMHTL